MTQIDQQSDGHPGNTTILNIGGWPRDGENGSDDENTESSQKKLVKKAKKEFDQVTETLEKSVKKMRRTAYIIFAITALVGIVAAVYLPHLTSSGAEAIKESNNSMNMTIYELFRGAAFAAAVTTVVLGLLNLGRASLDQATRFEKRLIAAHFLDFVLLSFDQNVRKSKMTLHDVMEILRAWSANVESAFAYGKFASSKSQTIEMKVGPDGVTAKSGSDSGKSAN